MRNYIERAKDFIAEIFPYVGEWENPWDICDDIDDFNEKNNRKVIMKHGIARIALITSDYVVKYDFDRDEVAEVGGCEAEVALYAKAKQDGFAYLFAEITPYHYRGRNFYIMPRINGIRDRWSHADAYMTDEENRWCDDHNLSDLHCNNYGFRNGHVCIIDYACTLPEESESDSESSSWS